MNISILGSTGSIGVQALEVADAIPDIRVLGLSAHSNIDLLELQIRKFKPVAAAVMLEEAALTLKRRLQGERVEILSGMEGIEAVASLGETECVINSLVGIAGLRPTLAAIKAGKDIALANKETLVAGGELIMNRIKKAGVALRPVDSEHSAIFQCLRGNEKNRIQKIHLTASGGPFKNKTLKELETVTLAEALKHPNWMMGKKITIDSATMMNKGLEVIEAKWLFDVELSQISVLVHPQSIIHSMVEYEDGSVIAQLGCPDMRLPIQYALTCPERVSGSTLAPDFSVYNKLTFEQPDTDRFPCLRLACDAIKIGGTLPALLNGANEAAVDLFLNGSLGFMDIPRLIEKAMAAYTVQYRYSLEDIIEADRWAREFITRLRSEE